MITLLVAAVSAWRSYPHESPWDADDELTRMAVATKAVAKRDRRQRAKQRRRLRTSDGVSC